MDNNFVESVNIKIDKYEELLESYHILKELKFCLEIFEDDEEHWFYDIVIERDRLKKVLFKLMEKNNLENLYFKDELKVREKIIK